MAAEYPVTFGIDRPERFQRPQVFLRVLVLIISSIVGNVVGLLFGLVYLVLPVLAAIFISRKGSERFMEEDGPRMIGWLRWLIALYSYLAFLTDRFPSERPEEIVRFEVKTEGTPTVGSALLRLIYSIPSAFVLVIIGIASAVIWLIAAVMILIQERYPEGLYNFQCGVLRWEARLLSYHASLVDRYPPFAIDTGPEAPQAPA